MTKPRLQRRRRTLAEVGEFPFLRDLLPMLPSGRSVVVGPGDDCAVTRSPGKNVLLTTDTLVAGVHFEHAWMTPRQIGRKAYRVNASDIAAMGGQPLWCLVNVGVPIDFPAADLSAIHLGVADAAALDDARIIGGNLSRARDLFISISLIGKIPGRPVLRSGGRPGHGMYVTGTLGEAALGLKDLQADRKARGAAVRRFREPIPRVQAGRVLADGIASAMIDVSDGLLRDLGHLCEASGVGAEVILENLPTSPRVRRHDPFLPLRGGEDYELLFAVPKRLEPNLRRLTRRLGCRVTKIGRLLPSREGICVRDAAGEPIPVDGQGFDHFRLAGGAHGRPKGAIKPRAGSVRNKRSKA